MKSVNKKCQIFLYSFRLQPLQVLAVAKRNGEKLRFGMKHMMGT
jgi:hypothetical protein